MVRLERISNFSMKDKALLKYLCAVCIYGTNGLFLQYINASSEFVVLCRGTIGSLFIALVMFLKKDKIDILAIRRNFWLLFVSGISLGLNWIFLFAGYTYGVAITSLCNYMAPIMVIVISAFIYRQKLGYKQLVCIICSIIGVVLISGIFESGAEVNYLCMIYGLLAALGFCALVFCNRYLKDIKPLDKTLVQLLSSTVTVSFYVYFHKGFPGEIDGLSLVLLLIMGVVHTGIAYIFYFDSINVLNVDTIAVLGYIKPALGVIIGACFLHEKLTVLGIIGAIMILSSAIFSEIGNKQ